MIMNVTYGYQLEAENDKFVSLLEESVDLFNELNVPGKYWVEVFPICTYPNL